MVLNIIRRYQKTFIHYSSEALGAMKISEIYFREYDLNAIHAIKRPYIFWYHRIRNPVHITTLSLFIFFCVPFAYQTRTYISRLTRNFPHQRKRWKSTFLERAEPAYYS